MSENGHVASPNGFGAEESRIGVFICHCGGNISDVVDVKRVAEEISKLPNVVLSTTHMFMCSDPGQAEIEAKIKELNLNRVIVAACSPTLHQITFRRALERAGLNQFLFEHVNVREQVSWVIEDKEAATRKATRLISAAVGRIRHLIPLTKRSIPIHNQALVIGGGVAGLVSARDLARRGINVTLIERDEKLGGRMLELDRVFPTNDRACDLLDPLLKEVTSNSRIRIYTNVDLIDSKGVIGDFNTTIRIRPPGMTPDKVDDSKCETAEIRSGAIVIAVGLDVYEPARGEYGAKDFPEVINLLDLAKMLNPSGSTGGKVMVNGKQVKSIAFIHCVGSRQHEGVHDPAADGKINNYCSRYCCTGIIHMAEEIKELFPDIDIYDFFQDVRTYGRWHEDLYTKASEKGVRFLRYDPHDPPVVTPDSHGKSPVMVRSKDLLTDGIEMEVPVDLVVLGTGLKAKNMDELIDLYRCSVGSDRFLLEVHPKLRPVELAVAGLFLAGSVQGPMDITESTASAAAAASKAAALITQGNVEMDPFIAKVIEELCSGCETCLTVCPYDAITRDDEKRIAIINEALCTGCGTCAAACPSSAIQQFGFNDDQIMAEVMMLLAKDPAEIKV